MSIPLDDRARLALQRAASMGEPVPPIPPNASFDDAGLARVLASPAPGDPPGVSRYLMEIWRERVDLQEAFPGMWLDPTCAPRFVLWAHHFAKSECGVPDVLVPSAPEGITDIAVPALPEVAPTRTPGVVATGYLRAALGLGVAARRLVSLLDAAGETVRAQSYDHTTSPLVHAWPPDNRYAVSADEHLDVVVLAVNGSETERLTRALGPRALQGAYRIGLWFWEVEDLNPAMASGLDHLDEVWVTSEFVAEAIRVHARETVTVKVIPLGADVSRRARIDAETKGVIRHRLGLPSGFVAGMSFDYASRIARKNPLGLLFAWERAFPNPFVQGRDRGPWLVIKTHNAEAARADRDAVRRAVAHRPDVLLIDATYSDADQHDFISALDLVVSLHRSEGYGLVLLEAMAQEIPAIATGYSGNLAFMNEENSWLVRAMRSTVPANCEPYPEGARWGEPSVEHAAALLAGVIGDPESDVVRARVARGHADVLPLVDGTAGIAFLQRRLAEIRNESRA